jgi:hypothetical protein
MFDPLELSSSECLFWFGNLSWLRDLILTGVLPKLTSFDTSQPPSRLAV